MAAAAVRLCPAVERLQERPVQPAAASTAAREERKSRPPVQPAERERLLLLHLPQVRLVAESLRVRLRFAMEFEDLVSYGVIGLLKAIERFDPERGVLLKTYAEHRIRGAILDGARAMDWLPRGARQRGRIEPRVEPRVEPKLARPSRGVPAAAAAVRYPLACMEILYAGANLEVFESLSYKAGLRGLFGQVEDDPEVALERAEMRGLLAHALSRLPERHRTVLELYYGQELSMKQIGQMLRIHESRISQLHAAAVKRLRSTLAPELARKAASRAAQPPSAKPAKYRLTAAQSSSVSTPMVSAAVSAT